MADTKLTDLTEISILDLADTLYVVNDTGPASGKLSIQRLLGHVHRGACQGRLTLTTGTPVTISDVTAASTLYWSPIDAGLVTLFDGTRWLGYKQAELSLALSGLTADKNYDAFLDYNAGTPALVLGTAWTNDTTRAVGLTTQDGIRVLSGTTTKRYVGTIRTISTTETADAGGGGTTQVGGKRFVWNLYNQVRRPLAVIDTADQWSYTTDTVRVANGATAPLNCVQFVIGVAPAPVEAHVLGVASIASNTTTAAKVGIGVDSSTAFSGFRATGYNGSASVQRSPVTGRYAGLLDIGYHFFAWLEKGANASCSFGGDQGADGTQCGLTATILA